MNLLLLAVVLAQQGSNIDQKLSLEVPVSRLGAVLDLLSTNTGIRFTADPGLAKNWVTIQVVDCSLKDLMARISETVHADWIPKSNGFNLNRSPDLEKAIRQAIIESRLVEAENAVAYLKSQAASAFDAVKAQALSQRLEQIQNNKDFEQSYVADQALRSELPQYRACSRLAALLPARDLATIPDGGRVVFSTAPTKMQRPLVGDVKGVFVEMLEEQARLDKSIADQGLSIKNPQWAGRLKSGATLPNKVLIIVTRRQEQGLHVVARLANTRGEITTEEAIDIKPEAERNPFLTSEIAGDKSTAMTPHPVLQNLSKVIGANNTDRSFLTSDARDVLLKPDLTEPGEIMLGHMVREHAKGEKLNLVAVISERSCIAGIVMATVAKPSWSRLAMILNLIGDDAKRSKGWLTICPRDPIENERTQIDRRILAEVASIGLSGKQPTLDQRIRFAKSFEGDYYWNLLGIWSLMAGLNGDFEDFDALRFYGSLSPTQLLTLKNEGGFYQYANLSDQQKRQLHYMTFVQRPYISTKREQVESEVPIETMRYGALTNEPTEALPEGIPGNAVFTMVDEMKEAVYGIGKVGAIQKQPITAMDLAWQQYSKSRLDLYPWASDQPTYESFRIGSQQTISMLFQFNTVASATRRIEQIRFSDEGKPLTLAQLGKKFNDDFNRFLKQYKDAEPPPP